MERKVKVLFLCGGNASRSQMAEGLLRAKAEGRVDTYSAGLHAAAVHPLAVEVMLDAGIDISKQDSKKVDELGASAFDLVITLCEEAREYCLRLPDGDSSPVESAETEGIFNLFIGVPTRLDWPMADPAVVEGDEQNKISAFRKARDEIAARVESLVEQGNLDALAIERRRTELYLDAVEDGIIMHDMNRHIFLFNRAAEQLTGFSKEEVLGRDCHSVFAPDGLCGSNCPFSAGKPDDYESASYEIGFRTKDGQDRRFRMFSSSVDLLQGGPLGVLAALRDITEVNELKSRLKKKYSFHGMVGVSETMQEIFKTIGQLTTSSYPVLITGESGTGKELVARAIHNESRRSAGPFVPINCGALPENILESELFGHVRGAFTGAIRDKKGRFELADGGTIFLDEVGELSPAFQVKLLRVLEQKSFEPVGSERTVESNVRVVSATNRDLKKMIAKEQFREDLFYRLSVVPIHLPPLRERKEDIPPLIEQVVQEIREETGKGIDTVSNEALDLLLSYEWPGNIRELINVLQFASVRCAGTEILPRHLPPEPRHGEATHPESIAEGGQKRRRTKLSIESVEEALEQTGGNKVKAARLLGVGRATLYRFLSRYPVS